MKCIWSIGNKINDRHKALAVLTLNNLLFDAILLPLHDATSVCSTLHSNSWKVKGKWQPSPPDISWDIQREDFHSTPHFLGGGRYMYVWWREASLTSKVRSTMFCPTWSLGMFSQSWEFVRPCGSIKRIWKLYLRVPLKKKSWLGWRKYSLSKCDWGQWPGIGIRIHQGDEGRHPLFCPLSPHSCCPVFLYAVLTCLNSFQQNNPSLTDVDEPFSCMDGRLKM